MEKDPRIYIRHILEVIANIETDTAGYDFESFRVDRRARQLVERNLEILQTGRRGQGSSFRNSLTNAAELSDASWKNVPISFSPAPPPARSDRLRNAMNGVLFA